MQSITQLPPDDGFKDFITSMKMNHPTKGIIPYTPFPYHYRLKDTIENNPYVIGTKFRQGGFTTFMGLYLLWKATQGKQCMFLTKTDSEACSISRMVRDFFTPILDKSGLHLIKYNDHQIKFEEGGNLFFYTPEPSRGKRIDYLYVDEAAFIKNFEQHWKAIWPCVAQGAQVIIFSTTNGVNNWFYQTHQDAEQGKNKFKVFDSDYWEHPDYNNQNWVNEVKANLGERGWRQEIMREFLPEESSDPKANQKAFLRLIDSLKPEQLQKVLNFIKDISG